MRDDMDAIPRRGRIARQLEPDFVLPIPDIEQEDSLEQAIVITNQAKVAEKTKKSRLEKKSTKYSSTLSHRRRSHSWSENDAFTYSMSSNSHCSRSYSIDDDDYDTEGVFSNDTLDREQEATTTYKKNDTVEGTTKGETNNETDYYPLSDITQDAVECKDSLLYTSFGSDTMHGISTTFERTCESETEHCDDSDSESETRNSGSDSSCDSENDENSDSESESDRESDCDDYDSASSSSTAISYSSLSETISRRKQLASVQNNKKKKPKKLYKFIKMRSSSPIALGRSSKHISEARDLEQSEPTDTKIIIQEEDSPSTFDDDYNENNADIQNVETKPGEKDAPTTPPGKTKTQLSPSSRSNKVPPAAPLSPLANLVQKDTSVVENKKQLLAASTETRPTAKMKKAAMTKSEKKKTDKKSKQTTSKFSLQAAFGKEKKKDVNKDPPTKQNKEAPPPFKIETEEESKIVTTDSTWKQAHGHVVAVASMRSPSRTTPSSSRSRHHRSASRTLLPPLTPSGKEIEDTQQPKPTGQQQPHSFLESVMESAAKVTTDSMRSTRFNFCPDDDDDFGVDDDNKAKDKDIDHEPPSQLAVLESKNHVSSSAENSVVPPATEVSMETNTTQITAKEPSLMAPMDIVNTPKSPQFDYNNITVVVDTTIPVCGLFDTIASNDPEPEKFLQDHITTARRQQEGSSTVTTASSADEFWSFRIGAALFELGACFGGIFSKEQQAKPTEKEAIIALTTGAASKLTSSNETSYDKERRIKATTINTTISSSQDTKHPKETGSSLSCPTTGTVSTKQNNNRSSNDNTNKSRSWGSRSIFSRKKRRALPSKTAAWI